MKKMKQQLLEHSLRGWYESNPSQLDLLDRINNGHSTGLPSLRQIDYLVVNYAKKHKAFYYVTTPEGYQSPFEIHSEYRSELKAYSKDNFDPFRRGGHLTLGGVESSLAQLNFFRWALPNGVIQYAQDHASEIEAEMKAINRKRKRGIKQELSSPSDSKCTIHPVSTVATFSVPQYEFYRPPLQEQKEEEERDD